MYRLAAFFLIFLTVSSMVVADPLYKWVDDQGNVHYSDKPQPGAKKIVLPKATTFKPPPAARIPSANSDTSRDRGQAASSSYTGLSITAPGAQETLWNVDSVTVTVAVAPALQPGDSVTISLDGTSQTVQGSSATFTGIDRGQHTATASVGGVSAQAVTFFVQKTTTKKPPTH